MADPIQQRWREREPAEKPARDPVDRATVLFAKLDPEIVISAQKLARLRARVEPAITDQQRSHTLWRLIRWSATPLATVLFVGMALAAGWMARGRQDAELPFPAPIEKREPLPLPVGEVGTHWREATGVPGEGTGKKLSRTRAIYPVARKVRPPLALPIPSPVPSTAPTVRQTASLPPTDSLHAEADLLASALRQLRQEKDPAGAVATLVIYRHEFPKGDLRGEALAAEIDADVQLGREGDALGLLEDLRRDGYAGVGRVLELRLLRAELLAKGGRCQEALSEFDNLTDNPAFEERALSGRAACRASLGDPAGSRSDYQRYLSLYPSGRFAAAARRAVGRNSGGL